MRFLFILLFASPCFGQNFLNDTTMSGTYDAAGKVMYIQGKISGNVTITNAIIDASPFIQIFDTSVIIGSNVRVREFSGMWYGAKPSNADNSRNLQIAINQCINRFSLYIPSGTYNTSQPLMIAIPAGSYFNQATLNIYGESTFWSDATIINYSGDSCAIGVQLNKGSRIHNVSVFGGWVSPSGSDSTYYNTSFGNYNNQGTSGNGVGIWVDPVGYWGNRSGSTGIQIYDCHISGFKNNIQISNSITQNGEIILVTNVQLGSGKVGIQASQAQEKGNVIRGIYSWGPIHTIISSGSQAGNYYVDGANIAGRCIRFTNWVQGGFFPSYFTRIYAESIGSVGTLSTSGLPLSVSNSSFDFAYKSNVGSQTLIAPNSNQIRFSNTSFRYYGNNDVMQLSGAATFDNCLFSGTVNGAVGNIYTTYYGGTVNYNGSQVLQVTKTDTIQPASVKITLRSSQ